jgi:hypothetical protein
MQPPGIGSRVAGVVSPFSGPAKWVTISIMTMGFCGGLFVGSGFVVDPPQATQFDPGMPGEGQATTASGVVEDLESVKEEVRTGLTEDTQPVVGWVAWMMSAVPLIFAIESAKAGLYAGVSYPHLVQSIAPALKVLIVVPNIVMGYSFAKHFAKIRGE